HQVAVFQEAADGRARRRPPAGDGRTVRAGRLQRGLKGCPGRRAGCNLQDPTRSVFDLTRAEAAGESESAMCRLAQGALRSAANSRMWRVLQRELLRHGDGRFPALDGVRALAALLIIFFHATVCVEQSSGTAVDNLPVSFARWFLARLWIG